MDRRSRGKAVIWNWEGSNRDGEKAFYLLWHPEGGSSPAYTPFSYPSLPTAHILRPWPSPPAKVSAETLRVSYPLPPQGARFTVAQGTKHPQVLFLRTTLGRVHIPLLHAGKQAGRISALAPLSQVLGWRGAGWYKIRAPDRADCLSVGA